MPQTEKENLGAGAGLAGAVALESGVELGELEVKARGYWEQVWRRSEGQDRDRRRDHDHLPEARSASLGDEGATVEVRGATGTVERVGERQTLVRLTAPVPGMLSVFAWDEGGGKTTAGVRAYLFSVDAADYVRREGAGLAGLAGGALRPGLTFWAAMVATVLAAALAQAVGVDFEVPDGWGCTSSLQR